MHTILAIETSSDLASAALLHAGNMISREASGVQTHSQTILPMVQELLKEAGITLAQCHAIAFGAGPGSFTGVRTACGIAQGLAFGAGLPVVPVVTLQAMAEACRNACDATDILVLLDARMDEVYWAQYRYADKWQTIIAPTLTPPSLVSPVESPAVCGNGLSAYPALLDRLQVKASYPGISPHAIQIARLADIELTAGRTVHARDVQPIYLRNKVAMTTAERLAKVSA